MKTNLNHWFYAVLVASALGACQENDESGPCDCPALGGPDDNVIRLPPVVVGPDVSYHEPSYNPAAGQQLAYRRSSRTELDDRPPAQITGLWTADLATRQQAALLTGYDILFRPNYGPGGWVAFNRGDGNVWKAKANGDSLRRLTDAVSYTPVWNRAGTRIACYRPSGPGAGVRILDAGGALVRVLNVDRMNAALAWSPDGNRLLCEYNPGNSRGMALYDLTTNQMEALVMDPPAPDTNGVIWGAAWAPDGRAVVWCGEQGLHEVDVASKRHRLLRSACAARRYFSPTISPDGRQIAVERQDQRMADDGRSMRQETNIWTLDRDGRNEQRVSF